MLKWTYPGNLGRQKSNYFVYFLRWTNYAVPNAGKMFRSVSLLALVSKGRIIYYLYNLNTIKNMH